jgi:hypothetical protein
LPSRMKDTSVRDTPARAATSAMVGRRDLESRGDTGGGIAASFLNVTVDTSERCVHSSSNARY